MADPNNLVVHQHRLAVMLICKAANTSVKWALEAALGLPRTHRSEHYFDTPGKAQIKRLRDQGYWTVSVVRHPMARIHSCWRDKVADPGRFHQPFRRKYGARVWPGMSFWEWLQFVAETPDEAADQHFRSMSHDLVVAGETVPEVIKIEAAGWWDRLRAGIADHCGLDIGAERRENTGVGGDVPATPGLVLARYREDFERFGYAP